MVLGWIWTLDPKVCLGTLNGIFNFILSDWPPCFEVWKAICAMVWEPAIQKEEIWNFTRCAQAHAFIVVVVVPAASAASVKYNVAIFPKIC